MACVASVLEDLLLQDNAYIDEFAENRTQLLFLLNLHRCRK